MPRLVDPHGGQRDAPSSFIDGKLRNGLTRTRVEALAGTVFSPSYRSPSGPQRSAGFWLRRCERVWRVADTLFSVHWF